MTVASVGQRGVHVGHGSCPVEAGHALGKRADGVAKARPKAFSPQRIRHFTGPVVVGVAGVESGGLVERRLHETVKLGPETVLKLSVHVSLSFPPLRPSILKPHL